VVGEAVDAEETARAHLTDFQKFLIQVSRHRGGKIGLTVLYLASGSRSSSTS